MKGRAWAGKKFLWMFGNCSANDRLDGGKEMGGIERWAGYTDNLVPHPVHDSVLM